jgi:hypothetical protein
MARELGRSSEWETEQVRSFSEMARNYLPLAPVPALPLPEKS